MTKESNNPQGDKPSKPTFRGEVAKSLASRRKRKENVSQAKAARVVKEKTTSREFWLVLAMLLTLTLLVIAVLLIPPTLTTIEGASGVEFLEKVFEYRRTILAVIITAFGAWVGAGAAYFFGRENLREATNAILQSKGKSAMERLRDTAVRNIPPLPLDWRPTTGWKLGQIRERLEARPDYWFIPVFSKDDDLVTVLEEEAFWRYLYDMSANDELKPTAVTFDGAISELMDREVSQLIDHVKATSELKQEFYGIYVRCNMEQSAADVYRKMQMESRDVRLAIVFDDRGKPTHFFTTTEVRRLLLDIV